MRWAKYQRMPLFSLPKRTQEEPLPSVPSTVPIAVARLNTQISNVIEEVYSLESLLKRAKIKEYSIENVTKDILERLNVMKRELNQLRKELT